LMQLLPSLVNPVTTLRPIFIATLSIEISTRAYPLDPQVYCVTTVFRARPKRLFPPLAALT
jgi:hypothetical protein